MSGLVQAQVYLTPELAGRIEAAAQEEGLSRSEVIRAALHAFFAPDGVDRPKEGLSRRLDRADRKASLTLALVALVLECLGLFVETWLAAQPAASDDDRRTPGERGAERLRAFRGTVLESLTEGGSELWDLIEAAAVLALDEAARAGEG